MFCCVRPYCAVEKGNQGVGQNHARMTVHRFVQTLYRYQYQKATPIALPLHELKTVQLECFMLMTQDSIGHENSST